MEYNEFEYDVAFSFCQEDEHIAHEINEYLSDNLNVFIYSKKQEKLVGTDGELEFKKTFSELSRVVIVLYRSNYGNTTWTRMEEEAIRGRAYEEGYDFTLFIPLEGDKQTPKYLPKTRIWYDLERFGAEGAANIIRFIITERGGNSRDITSHDKIEKLKRKSEFKEKLNKYYFTAESNKDSSDEMNLLIEIGEKKVKTLFEGMENRIQTEPSRLLQIGYKSYLLEFHKTNEYSGSRHNSFLFVTIGKYVPQSNPLMPPIFQKYNSEKYLFGKNVNWENIWQFDNKDGYYQTDYLVEHSIIKFLDYIEKQEFGKRD